jgi:hypothetical protein
MFKFAVVAVALDDTNKAAVAKFAPVELALR